MVDVLIQHGIVVTVDPQRRIIEDGAVAIEGDKIVAVGKTEKVKKEYSSAERVFDASRMMIMPGLIDCHVHLAQALIRGCADDVSLVEWLRERVWPLQGHYSKEDGKISALLCMLEMIKSGTVCFVESMLHTRYGFDGIAEAVRQSGMRAVLSKTVMDTVGYGTQKAIMHEGMIETRKQSLNEAVRMIRKWNGGADGRIHVWFGPRTPGGCSPELYREISQLAKEHHTGITMHLAEVKEDVKYTKKEFNLLPVEFAKSVDLLGPNVLLAHAVWLTSKEIHMLAKSNTRVCHCPASNMKLASGIAKVHEMLQAGVTVSLGCDGGPSNNCYDMIREMKLAALLHKVHSLDPLVMPAESVIEMATTNGSESIGLSNEIGAIMPGRKADVILIDLKKPHLTPLHNPISHLVYAANGSDVDTVIVNGKIVMENREVKTIDETWVMKEAEERGLAITKKAGISIESRWPLNKVASQNRVSNI